MFSHTGIDLPQLGKDPVSKLIPAVFRFQIRGIGTVFYPLLLKPVLDPGPIRPEQRPDPVSLHRPDPPQASEAGPPQDMEQDRLFLVLLLMGQGDPVCPDLFLIFIKTPVADDPSCFFKGYSMLCSIGRNILLIDPA